MGSDQIETTIKIKFANDGYNCFQICCKMNVERMEIDQIRTPTERQQDVALRSEIAKFRFCVSVSGSFCPEVVPVTGRCVLLQTLRIFSTFLLKINI